jgi:hypothetical protein
VIRLQLCVCLDMHESPVTLALPRDRRKGDLLTDGDLIYAI